MAGGRCRPRSHGPAHRRALGRRGGLPRPRRRPRGTDLHGRARRQRPALGIDAGAARLDVARWRGGVPTRRAAPQGHRRAGARLRARDRRRGERGGGSGGGAVGALAAGSARSAHPGRTSSRRGSTTSDQSSPRPSRNVSSARSSAALASTRPRPPTAAAEDADVDGLAARSSALEEQIRARVEATLKAKGISPDES